MIRKWLFIIALLFALSCAASSKKKPSFDLLKKISPTQKVIVHEVLPNSSAARGGLESGDHILKVNSYSVFSHKDFQDALARVSDGRKSIFTVLRNNHKNKIAIVPKRVRNRFGFSYKVNDLEISQHSTLKTRQDDVDSAFEESALLFHKASLGSKSNRSPKQKAIHLISDKLVNKGYIFTEIVHKGDDYNDSSD